MTCSIDDDCTNVLLETEASVHVSFLFIGGVFQVFS